MTHMLDTNICVFLLRGKKPKLRERIRGFLIGDLVVSSVTAAELRYGAEKSHDPQRQHAVLDRLFLTIPIVPFDEPSATQFGMLRRELEKKGTPIGMFDCMIGAHARSLDVVLATNNTREFKRIARLRLEDWV